MQIRPNPPPVQPSATIAKDIQLWNSLVELESKKCVVCGRSGVELVDVNVGAFLPQVRSMRAKICSSAHSGRPDALRGGIFATMNMSSRGALNLEAIRLMRAIFFLSQSDQPAVALRSQRTALGRRDPDALLDLDQTIMRELLAAPRIDAEAVRKAANRVSSEAKKAEAKRQRTGSLEDQPLGESASEDPNADVMVAGRGWEVSRVQQYGFNKAVYDALLDQRQRVTAQRLAAEQDRYVQKRPHTLDELAAMANMTVAETKILADAMPVLIAALRKHEDENVIMDEPEDLDAVIRALTKGVIKE